MANVTVAGASYTDVPAVALPTTGGGTSTFYEVDGSQTATANGTYDVTSLAEMIVNVSGGGGASNLVTGTFTGTTTGAAMDVTLNYSGNGYPIAVGIMPTSGYTGAAIESVIQRYGVALYAAIKRSMATPTYATSGVQNQFAYVQAYKSSASTGSTLSASSAANIAILSGGDAGSTASGIVRFKNNKTMSVYIASSSYGFIANYEYTYYVIYSS